MPRLDGTLSRSPGSGLVTVYLQVFHVSFSEQSKQSGGPDLHSVQFLREAVVEFVDLIYNVKIFVE